MNRQSFPLVASNIVLPVSFIAYYTMKIALDAEIRASFLSSATGYSFKGKKSSTSVVIEKVECTFYAPACLSCQFCLQNI